jgi:hypothetical protein
MVEAPPSPAARRAIEPRARATQIWQANLEAIRECRPELVEPLERHLRDAKVGPWWCESIEPRVFGRDFRRPWTEIRPFALAGLGDGGLLRSLALQPPFDSLGRQQAVAVIEPSLDRVISILTRHDFSAPSGPIRSGRFLWFVGDDWAGRMLATLQTDPYLPRAWSIVEADASLLDVRAEVRRITDQLGAIDALKLARVMDHYGRFDPAQAFSAGFQRPPRALILTTRFSTVLQHASRDTARALERLGWSTRLAIESQPWHTAGRSSLIDHLDQFTPDLVFQIDHLRHEHGPLIPENLPFVCWIQDHLPNLTSSDAGAKVGRRDFVLTASISAYRDRYAYPADQLIPIHKLTRIPDRPATWTSDGEDFAFVSNASADPTLLAERNLASLQCSAANIDLMRRVQRRMIDIYASGASLQTAGDIMRVIDDLSGGSLDEPTRQQFVRALVHPFNDALYRQQGLGWASDFARRNRLTLGLYGQGWDRHPRLAQHARGVIGYGEPLERLTRATRINLQIMPNCCLHQRLLDGLVAGGFYLIRQNTADALLTQWATFIRHKLPPEAMTDQQALRLVAPEDRVELEALLARRDELSVIGEALDPVAEVRTILQTHHFDENDQLLPALDEVTFTSAESFERQATRFLNDEPARRAIAERQRSSVERRKSYESGMRQMLDAIAHRLASPVEAS